MTDLLVDVVLAAHNGIAKDACVNTFAIQAAPGFDPVADLSDIVDPIAGFYNTSQSTGDKVANYMSTSIDRAANATQVRVYDITGHLDGSPHGSPVAVGTFTLAGALSGQNLPAEVAAVLTWRGEGWVTAPVELGISRPKQRRTGRIYVGPLLFDAIAQADYTDGRLLPDFRTTLLDAAEDLQSGLFANGYVLSVWSRSNEAMYDVVAFQVDDAPDTQRRRGQAATLRTTRNVA